MKIERLRKTFGDLVVLQDITVTLTAGRPVAIIGRSGSGKSTLLEILAGLLQYDSGSILPEPGVIRTSLVSQDYRGSLFPWLSVRRNVQIALPPHDRKKQIEDEVIDRVGLHEWSERFPYEMSGGMRQRLAIARALVGSPGLLLFDEPLASLDAVTRLELQDLLSETLAGATSQTVLVTHDVEEALYLADEVYCLSVGGKGLRYLGSFNFTNRPYSQDVKFIPEFVAARSALLSALNNS